MREGECTLGALILYTTIYSTSTWRNGAQRERERERGEWSDVRRKWRSWESTWASTYVHEIAMQLLTFWNMEQKNRYMTKNTYKASACRILKQLIFLFVVVSFCQWHSEVHIDCSIKYVARTSVFLLTWWSWSLEYLLIGL